MANSFLTTKNIARQILPELIDNLVMPNLCHKDYSDTFAAQGDTIRVRKPTKFTASAFDVNAGISAQDITEESVDVKLDTIATVDVNIEAIEAATNIEDLTRQVLRPAAIALAEKINADGLKQYKYAYGILGTAGTTPDGLDDFANARKFLNEQKAPLSMRRAVWDVDADAAFTQIGNLVKVNEAGTNTALREGEIGRVFGLDNYMSQAVADHSASTLTAGGTSATGVKVKANVAAGKTIVLISNASASGTLSGSVVAGDILAITHSGSTIMARVAEASTASDNELSVKLDRAVTVSANDAVVLKSYAANLVFHENAIAFVTRPLIAPAGAESYTTSFNGFSLRVVRDYDIQYKREKLSVDVLYGYKTVYPELSAVYMG